MPPAGSLTVRAHYLYRELRRLLTEQDGPTATEYAVMLALIIAVCLTTLTTLGNSLLNSYQTSNSVMFGS
jgi:pilus assembly protein Flp/PilA